MRSGMLVVFGAAAVVLAIAIGGTFWMGSPTETVAQTPLEAPETVPTEYHLKTGDTFWGLHLDGVVPCSTLLVKGGGHLVMLSHVDTPDRRCYYQVKDTKVVELGDVTFRLTVTDEDHVHVTREMVGLAVADSPMGE